MTVCWRCTEDPPACDKTLLSSAPARPRQHLAYSREADIIRMATAYTAGIVGNHSFVDGNKRTGFVIGVLFLELNGYRYKRCSDRNECSSEKKSGIRAEHLNQLLLPRAITPISPSPARNMRYWCASGTAVTTV